MGATVTDMAAEARSMAPADLLIGLRERVPLSAAQIARATGADEQRVHAWLKRRDAPSGVHARRAIELTAFVEEMARNVDAQTLADWWLDGNVDLLDGANPLDEIAAGRYEQMMEYALGLSDGVFT